MDVKLKEKLADALNVLKDEFEKQDILYKHGIDLTNYDKKYIDTLENLISFLIGGECKEEIGWWLYDGSEKIYYIKEGEERIPIVVEKAEDFINYLINNKKTKKKRR